MGWSGPLGIEQVRIYGLQLDIVWENKSANRERIERLLGERRPVPWWFARS